MSHHHRKKVIDIASAIVLLALIALDVALWQEIFAARNAVTASIDFLPVTQGESALLVVPGNVTVLTDAGADNGIVTDLQKAMPPGSAAYIDLAIISYPQTADYDGYNYVLQHYGVGAFLYNGRADAAHAAEWNQLTAAIAAKHIPLITIGAGDRIRIGNVQVDILSPDAVFATSPTPADTGIVQRIITPTFSVLLAADIGTNVEDALLAQHADMRADILKAPFPGLGAATGDAFLRAIAPRTIVIAPGAKNTASAPTKAMLAHLASGTAAAIVTSKPGIFLLYNK